MSILDQLLGGAGPEGVTYDLAVQLLGYTPDSLLDESIEAFSAHDGSTVFGVIDKVIESGQDPRRFAEDLLQRLRDLIIVKAVPDALTTGLLDVPDDLAERLLQQASSFGGSELTRSADIVNEALVEFRGATAPRLLLELMGARMLVPTADYSTQRFQARLDRLERRMGIRPRAPACRSDRRWRRPRPRRRRARRRHPRSLSLAKRHRLRSPNPCRSAAPRSRAGRGGACPVAEPEPWSLPAVAAPEASARRRPASLTIADVRRLWPEILDKIRDLRRFAWVMLASTHRSPASTATP